MNKSFTDKFKPAVRGKSDKYSWHLYRRIRKQGRESVWLVAHDAIIGLFDPSLEDLKAQRLHPSKIAIGRMHADGDFTGKKLNHIFSPADKYDNYCFPGGGFQTDKWIEITDWFWNRYEHYGRCAFLGDWAHEWQDINRNAKKCIHCGKHIRRTVKTVRTVERKEFWA